MASMEGAEGFDDTTMQMLSANLPSSAFANNTPDPRLERARQETERTNQITPLLKEELRLRILSKRLQKGEPEIETSSGEPRSYELTEEEKAKRERRRAQNRSAAKKCRHKRKMKSLSDAEKYRIISEQNQQLRNDVMYLKHKEEIYKKFCREHILSNQCSSVPVDESSRRRLQTLLSSNTWCEQQIPAQSAARSTMSRTEWSHFNQNQPLYTTSSPAGPLSNYHNQDQASCSNATLALSSTAAQAVYREEQSVNSFEELKELPVHEISSLLPTEPDFSVSDHSLESTPPGLSPTTLFSTMSPSSVGMTSSGVPNSIYFSQLTPSTPYSGNNTSSFSSSNDDIFAVSHSDNDIQLTSSYLDASVSSSDLNHETSVDHRGIYQNNKISRHVGLASSLGETISTSSLSTHAEGHGLLGKHENTSTHALVSGSDCITNEHVFSGAATSNLIVNTAFLGGYPNSIEYLLTNYLSVEHGVTDLSNCHGDPVSQTVPISPLTPPTPPSPRVTLSPLSPSSLFVDMNRMDCNAVCVQLSTSEIAFCHNTVNPSTVSPARPIVRRTSSTTSVPSPYFNHLVSIALSPPPSVPSPTSNGIPESPSILTVSTTCDESVYVSHFSPVSAATSTDHSPVRLFDVTEEEFSQTKRPEEYIL